MDHGIEMYQAPRHRQIIRKSTRLTSHQWSVERLVWLRSLPHILSKVHYLEGKPLCSGSSTPISQHLRSRTRVECECSSLVTMRYPGWSVRSMRMHCSIFPTRNMNHVHCLHSNSTQQVSHSGIVPMDIASTSSHR